MQENSKFPWLFSGKGTYRNCRGYMTAFHNYGTIPMRCRHYCWKVVIRLNGFGDLIKLMDYLDEYKGIAKCGFDNRDYTEDRYIGFIYNDSEEEAKGVVKKITPDLPWAKSITVARGCTEMRMKVPIETWDDIKPQTINFKPNHRYKQTLNRRLEVFSNWGRWEENHAI